jgi:hypothetical protein
MASDWSQAALGERERRTHSEATPRAQQRRSALANLWGACVGSCAASCIGVPMENLKHRGNLHPSLPAGDIFQSLISILRKSSHIF